MKNAKRLQIQKDSPDGVLSDEEKTIVDKIFFNQAIKDKMTIGKLTITPYFIVIKSTFSVIIISIKCSGN